MSQERHELETENRPVRRHDLRVLRLIHWTKTTSACVQYKLLCFDNESAICLLFLIKRK